MRSDVKNAPLLVYVLGAFFSLLPIQALAIDAFEIQVYNGSINSIGEYSLETHLNHVFSAKKTPDFEEQTPYAHLTHLTFEFARGMTPFWEAGAYLQTAITQSPNLEWAGVKLRSKLVVPDVEKTHFHLGVNTEISNIPSHYEDARWGFELRPIIGYTWEWVTVLFNPIFDVAFSGDSQVPAFEPALKTMVDTHQGFGLGFEYYADFGELNTVGGLDSQEHYLFGAFDLIGKSLELNVGIGAGLTSSSNGLVAKAIVGHAL
jgi:hypothetical protein